MPCSSGCENRLSSKPPANRWVLAAPGSGSLVKLLDQLDFNQLGMQQKFEEELKRFNKFQRGVLGYANPKAAHEEVDPKTYARYTLKEGTNEEKRELMGCFKSKLKITKGIVTIEQ